MGTYKLDINVAKNPLGIETSHIGEQVRLYPNPARDYFMIDLSSFNGNAEEIQLMNVLGKNVTGLIPVNHNQKVKVPVENLPEGIYFIRLQTDKGMISREIVIRK